MLKRFNAGLEFNKCRQNVAICIALQCGRAITIMITKQVTSYYQHAIH